MTYQHRFMDSADCIAPGKAVCVARNYSEHARELGNAVPVEPVLFMKPSTAFVPFEEAFALPTYGHCHYELEIAVLIGKRLCSAGEQEVQGAIAGYALAFDLTLRDVQDTLKKQGYPWERAKAFDGSCPISRFLLPSLFPNPLCIRFSLHTNGQLRQSGDTKDMVTGIYPLITYACKYFTLLPGDVILTGTPAGVGPLKSGDELALDLDGQYRFTTRVI